MRGKKKEEACTEPFYGTQEGPGVLDKQGKGHDKRSEAAGFQERNHSLMDGGRSLFGQGRSARTIERLSLFVCSELDMARY